METRAYFNNVVDPAMLKKRLLDRRQKKGPIFNSYVISQSMPFLTALE